MTGKNCELDIRAVDDLLEVSLRGEIDHHSAVSVRGRIDDEITVLRPKRLVIDLSGIEFMDSSGLGLIMGRYALMQRMDGALTVKNPNDRIIRIFELAGLDKIVDIDGVRKKTKRGKGGKNENKGK